MPELKDLIYQFASLSEYSLKERFLIRAADLIFFLAIKITGMMTRFEVDGIEHLRAIETAGKVPIYAFWHDRIFLSTYFWKKRGIVVLTSKSFDGEYIARFIQRFGYGAIRGSSSRGGSKALVELIKAMEPKEVHVVSGRADATHAELQIAGKESDGSAMKGTANLVMEDGAWKIEKVETNSSMH